MSRTILALILLCATSPASAQQTPCGPRENLLEMLAQDFDEAPTAVGMASNGDLIELLSSADGATWTMILSEPTGRSCMLAAGKDWQFLNAPTEPVIGDGI